MSQKQRQRHVVLSRHVDGGNDRGNLFFYHRRSVDKARIPIYIFSFITLDSRILAIRLRPRWHRQVRLINRQMQITILQSDVFTVRRRRVSRRITSKNS